MARVRQVSPFRRSLGAFAFLTLALAVPVAQAASITSITVDEAAERILSQRGRVTVVLLWKTTCPASRGMLAEFEQLAEDYSSRGVSILAFSTDEDPDDLDTYLSNNRFRFLGLHLQRWHPGELSAAMGRADIEVAPVFGLPLIAVLDRTGRRIGQHSGGRGAAMAKEWLDSLELD